MRRVDNANQTAGTGAFNNYQFDFGLGNGLGKGLSNAPLKDQKPSGAGFGSPWTTPQVPKSSAGAPQSASSGWATGAQWSSSHSKSQGGGSGGYSSGSSQAWASSTTSTQTGWAGYQPMTQGLAGAKPTDAAASGTTGIGGGIGGTRSAPMKSSLRSDGSKLAAAGLVGVAQNQSKDDVFGDLLSTALNKSNASINSKPVPKPSSFSLGKLDSSLPKDNVAPVHNTPLAKIGRSSTAPSHAPAPESVARRQTAGSAERDSFPPVSASSSVTYEDDFFSFPNDATPGNGAPTPIGKSSSNDPFGLSGSPSDIGVCTGDPFAFGGLGKSVPPSRVPPPARSTPVGDPFDVFNVKQSPSVGRKPVDPMDFLFSKSTTPTTKVPPPAPVPDDGWGIFGGGGSGGASGGNEPTTTELEGLPPPPGGVTAISANEKGSEFYKNGQFPDAIKWLSWSIQLLKGKSDNSLLAEVLTCRISCFKEIGEMKKAVADCSQAIELQPSNVALLLLRSNLYESMEKYKLGVSDLKLVLKLDNNNMKARQTLARLERIAAQQ